VTIIVSGRQITAVSVPIYPSGNGRDAQINAYALPTLKQETLAAHATTRTIRGDHGVRASCGQVNGRLRLGYGGGGPSTTPGGCVRRLGRLPRLRPRRDQFLPGAVDPFRSIPSALGLPAAAPSAWALRRVESGDEGVEAGGEPFVAVVEPDVFAEGDQGGEAVGWQ
jgi:hypothetical protein